MWVSPPPIYDLPLPPGKPLRPLGAAQGLDLGLRIALGRFWYHFFASAALLGAHVVSRDPIFWCVWTLKARFFGLFKGSVAWRSHLIRRILLRMSGVWNCVKFKAKIAWF